MKSILWPFRTGGLKETHTMKQYHQDHIHASYQMCTQLVMSLGVKHKTPGHREKGSLSEPWGLEKNQDKLLGPRSLKRDPALTILHTKTFALRRFSISYPNLS